jgi:hypothetical protein
MLYKLFLVTRSCQIFGILDSIMIKNVQILWLTVINIYCTVKQISTLKFIFTTYLP